MLHQKVIAYFMHEIEQSEIELTLKNVKSTQGYFIGNATEEDITNLRNKGILVEVFKPQEKQIDRNIEFSSIKEKLPLNTKRDLEFSKKQLN